MTSRRTSLRWSAPSSFNTKTKFKSIYNIAAYNNDIVVLDTNQGIYSFKWDATPTAIYTRMGCLFNGHIWSKGDIYFRSRNIYMPSCVGPIVPVGETKHGIPLMLSGDYKIRDKCEKHANISLYEVDGNVDLDDKLDIYCRSISTHINGRLYIHEPNDNFTSAHSREWNKLVKGCVNIYDTNTQELIGRVLTPAHNSYKIVACHHVVRGGDAIITRCRQQFGGSLFLCAPDQNTLIYDHHNDLLFRRLDFKGDKDKSVTVRDSIVSLGPAIGRIVSLAYNNDSHLHMIGTRERLALSMMPGPNHTSHMTLYRFKSSGEPYHTPVSQLHQHYIANDELLQACWVNNSVCVITAGDAGVWLYDVRYGRRTVSGKAHLTGVNRVISIGGALATCNGHDVLFYL